MSEKYYGWAGTILDVNLSDNNIKKIPLPMELARKYIGGSGLMASILYRDVGPEIDALSDKNLTMIAQGPLSGTIVPSSGRYEIYARSPLTGIIGRSNGGGFFGPELKWAGYDVIIVRGESKAPVYLWIDNEEVEIRDAGHLWGKDTWETQRIIREELGDHNIQTLKIGPAGENLCFNSCVIGDLSRAAGKNSIGAVWGAKKLKAIAVRGSKGVNIARPNDLYDLSMKLMERAKKDPLYAIHTSVGSPGWVSDPLAKKAWAKEERLQEIMSDKFENHFDKNLSCYGCPLHCSHWYTVKEGKYKGVKGEGLEGNAVIYGGMVEKIYNSAFICAYNTLCNKLGLHIDHPGCAISWAMDLYENGIITKADTDGIELTWGNEEAVLTLTKKIAHREGFGAVLDGYPIRAAEQIGRGSDKYISHVKGNPGRGPGIELSLEWTLALAVATRGRDHLTGAPWITTPGYFPELMPQKHLEKLGRERFGDADAIAKPWKVSPSKAKYVYDLENICSICDMTGVCKFMSEYTLYNEGIHLDDFVSLLSAATGENFTAEDLVEAAERQLLTERSYNARAGLGRDDDYPNAFDWEEKRGEPHPLYEGKLPITLKDYDAVLDYYYEVRGVDKESGQPLEEKLKSVGLEEIVEDLKKRKIISKKKQ